MTLLLLFLLTVASEPSSTCQSVQGNTILGRDLAAADSAFRSIPPETQISFAPAPGSHRIFSGGELLRIAQRYGIPGEFHELCFTYPVRKLEPGEIREAMKESLGMEKAEIELKEFSMFPAPAGKVFFPLSSLPRPSLSHEQEPVVWRGYVQYGNDRKFTIWGKVRITVSQESVVARQDLPAGQMVNASQVETKTIVGFPSSLKVATAISQVAGLSLKRSVKVGTPIPIDAIEMSTDGATKGEVMRGDLVEVNVEVGAAHLKLGARAESSGSTGETVTLRNPKSGKTFPAQVIGKGKVIVKPGETGA